MLCKDKTNVTGLLLPQTEYISLTETCVHWFIWCLFSFSAPEPDVSSDSSEMVKAIIQTVQNQDKVLKDLYTHLR